MAVEEEAVVVAIERADATAGNLFLTLSNPVGEQQVGLLPYFFRLPTSLLPSSRVSFQVTVALMTSHTGEGSSY